MPSTSAPRSPDHHAPAWLDRAAYPFGHRYVDLPAGRMHYVDEGSGDPVLFVHGTPSWSFEFRHLIKTLAPLRRCIAPDHIGFGLSNRPHGFAYTPEAHAAALETFVERLGLSRFALVVHDFGGPIGLPLALDDRFDVTRLVIMNTWMWPIQDDRSMARGARIIGSPIGRLLYAYANASLRLLMPTAYGDRSKLTPAIHRQYLEPFRDRSDRVRVLHTLAKALIGSHRFYADLWHRSGRLEGRPTLIVWGLKDRAFGTRHLTRWQQRLSQAMVVAIPDAGHWPHEESPAEVADAIRAFLE
jgi:haloalkane dehalogenase